MRKRSKTTRKSSTKTRSRSREREDSRDRDRGRDRDDDRGRDRGSRRGKVEGDWFNVTKLFQSRNNDDIYNGRVQNSKLGELIDKLTDIDKDGLAANFVVNLGGKWGEALSVIEAEPYEESRRGSSRGRGRGNDRGRGRDRGDDIDDRDNDRGDDRDDRDDNF